MREREAFAMVAAGMLLFFSAVMVQFGPLILRRASRFEVAVVATIGLLMVIYGGVMGAIS